MARKEESKMIANNELEKKIIEAFEVFDHSGKNVVDVREIGTILRSLGCCPTEEEVQEVIMETENKEATGTIALAQFLPYMCKIIIEHRFYPASAEMLLEAFQYFDKEGRGFLTKERFTKLMMEEGEPFTQIVNTYKRITKQASWDEDTMARALLEVKNNNASEKSTAIKFNIPITTLGRHIKSRTATKKLDRFRTVFTPKQEYELLEYMFYMDNLFFGLTKTDFLQLVYQFAELNNTPQPFKIGSDGHDLYKGFIIRNPDLTTIARARGF